MDAIFFMLGVKSAQLRSSQLKDLVYRGRWLARNTDGEDSGQAQPDDDEEGEGEEDGEELHVDRCGFRGYGQRI